jgi:hypothetical protein
MAAWWTSWILLNLCPLQGGIPCKQIALKNKTNLPLKIHPVIAAKSKKI